MIISAMGEDLGMAESIVRCSWQPAGQVALVDGMLVFPRVL
jgi:hypothetical protein